MTRLVHNVVSMFLFSNLWGQNSDVACQKTMLKVVEIVLQTKKLIICNFVPFVPFLLLSLLF
jgi:hypothetical protein